MLKDLRLQLLCWPKESGFRRSCWPANGADGCDFFATFAMDDGLYGSHERPILREYSFPVTAYMTTYYVQSNRPVFGVMLLYLLWKASGTNRRGLHFGYPGGRYLPEFPSWLRAYGLQSATTCEFGLAPRPDDPMLLPPVMGTSALTQGELEGWFTGVSAWMRVRRYPFSREQILEDEAL